MSAPTLATVSYVSTLPSTTSTVVLPITPDYTTWVLNLTRMGGVSFTDASGVLTWVPQNQILKITFA